MGTPAWEAGLCSYGEEPRMDLHDRIQVVLPLAGVLKIEIEGEAGLAGAGYLALVGRRLLHTYSARGENRFLVLDLDQRMVEEMAEAMDLPGRGGGLLAAPRFLPLDRRMASLATLLEEELRSEGPGDRLLRESLVRYAAGLLLQRHQPSGRRGGASILFSRGAGIRAVEHMREHYADNVAMADIAAAAGMSVSRFHRFFRHHTGVTPLQYLTALRIERAKDLLRRTDLSIVQVALEVGYQSQSSFTRVFTRTVGVTPQAYRSAR